MLIWGGGFTLSGKGVKGKGNHGLHKRRVHMGFTGGFTKRGVHVNYIYL